MLGPEELSRPVYWRHVDVDAVDLADPRPNAEELLIAIDEVRGLRPPRLDANEVAFLARALLFVRAKAEGAHRVPRWPPPRFATPEEIDGALERARQKDSK